MNSAVSTDFHSMPRNKAVKYHYCGVRIPSGRLLFHRDAVSCEIKPVSGHCAQRPETYKFRNILICQKSSIL